MIPRLAENLSPRAAIALAVVLIALLVAPLFANDYLLTVLILIFYFAYTGQAWNIMPKATMREMVNATPENVMQGLRADALKSNPVTGGAAPSSTPRVGLD